MPNYSKSSIDKRDTCHEDLITLATEVIKVFDNTILYGHRSPQEQFELYKKGRAEIKGDWCVFNLNEIVTYKDGFKKLSRHNIYPSEAIDMVPYPIDWKDRDRIIYFAGVVMGIAHRLKAEGKITHDITWGNDWDNDTDLKDQKFHDLLHFQIKK